ncbi:MAG: hypothetical protein IT428_22965 [Planctomycetaceae bacterium]|nr:hypothetical protein [Planctomycetaceae bacterium]
MPGRQLSGPLLIVDGTVSRLQRVSLRNPSFDEARLQSLLFSHPELLPIEELEPVFRRPIPVARELLTPAGPIDVVYINEDGFLCLVETKLWRNPESRRSVVAQIIDYTKEMAKWCYEDLCAAVRRARPDLGTDPLVELVRGGVEEFDELTFVDSISRNLRLGRFLLLIAGDGIREDVEHLVEFLQKTPQLHFTLALVEIGLYQLSDGKADDLLVQPRILARTQEVTRSIVEINAGIKPTDVRITIPRRDDVVATDGKRRPITEQLLLEELRASTHDDNVVQLASWLIDNAERYQLTVDWGDSGPVFKYYDDELGTFFPFFQIHRSGVLAQARSQLASECQRFGLPMSIIQECLNSIAELIPGSKVISYKTPGGRLQELVVFGPKFGPTDWPPLTPLVGKEEQLMNAVGKAVNQLQKAIATRPPN